MFIRNPRLAAMLVCAGFFAAETHAEPEFTLWETGGMYFCVPYVKGTIETDLNAWYEDEAPGGSLYGSYAFSDNFTLKLDVPLYPESTPFFQSMKVTGLYGMQTKEGDLSCSGDANIDYNWSEGERKVIPSLGVNAGKRWGKFALLARVGAGVSMVADSSGTSSSGVCEIEAAPFIYSGSFGMTGVPLMFEYADKEASVNFALDWELYLPGGISLWIVPRYEVVGGSGFSIWTGIAWMRMPE